uniref:Uncharacterized protein n=1 Tax=Anguilla anguilla TaxID=7936 RepID=A0A0E9TH17_ANGAN
MITFTKHFHCLSPCLSSSVTAGFSLSGQISSFPSYLKLGFGNSRHSTCLRYTSNADWLSVFVLPKI